MNLNVKPVKFDLSLNGQKVSTLEQLQDNFSADILPLFQSGLLAKWFASRDLTDQAMVINAISKETSELEQLKKLCQVLGLDDDETVLQYLLDARSSLQRDIKSQNEIEIPPVVSEVNLDELFLIVPEVTLPNGAIIPSFQVARYVASQSHIKTFPNDVSVPIAEAMPWVQVSFDEAKAACQEMGGHLITATQWLAIAYDVAHQACNWDSGIVGVGNLFQGLRQKTVGNVKPANYVSSEPNVQRWFTLSNGEKICDMNGNVFQWVFDDVQDNKTRFIAKPIDKHFIALITFQPKNEEEGLSGWLNRALGREAYWRSVLNAGMFNLDQFYGFDFSYDAVGFRCTKRL